MQERPLARRVRRSSGPLDLRSQAILRAVIEEYVTTATPVGSQALVERYRPRRVQRDGPQRPRRARGRGPPDPPAHVGAGRVPTEHGYRFYVESIVDSVPLPPVEQLMIRHQFGQVEYASEHWFRLAATTLASVTRAAGLATPAKPRAAHLRRLDLVAISDRLASLILVLREGALKQVLVTLDHADGPGGADRGRRPPQRAARRPDRRARRRAPRVPGRGRPGDATSPRRVGERVRPGAPGFDGGRDRGGLQRRPAQRHGGAGVRPEREAPPRLRRPREPRLPRRAGRRRRRLRPRPGLHRRREPGRGDADVSLVLAPYGQPGRAVGVVGVLGPTRMAYPQAIGTVRFVSGLMNELVDHLYA